MAADSVRARRRGGNGAAAGGRGAAAGAAGGPGRWSPRRGGRGTTWIEASAPRRRPGGRVGRIAAGLIPTVLVLLAAAVSCGGDETIEVRRTEPYGRELAPAAARDGGVAFASTVGGSAPFAEAPPAEAFGQDALLYRIGESPCAVLRAGLDGVAAGLCGDELQPRVYLRPDRPLRLAELVARYAPFELEVGDEEVELHGRGGEEAGPVERRMVLEWARRLMAEARGVTATRGFRLGFEWQRQLRGGLDCDALAVYLSGEALATTCDGLRTSGQVPAEQMAPILAWHDRLAPFQVVRQGGGGGESVSERLVVPGAGEAEQDEKTVEALTALAARLHTDVLARQLAVQQAEEAREAALEAARLENMRAAEAAAAAQRPWMPPSAQEDESEMTLSEAIAVGADPEAVEEEAAPLVPGEEGEEDGGGEDAGGGEAGDDAGAVSEPAAAEPADDGGGGDEGGGGADEGDGQG
jgi:hypothetical protein